MSTRPISRARYRSCFAFVRARIVKSIWKPAACGGWGWGKNRAHHRSLCFQSLEPALVYIGRRALRSIGDSHRAVAAGERECLGNLRPFADSGDRRAGTGNVDLFRGRGDGDLSTTMDAGDSVRFRIATPRDNPLATPHSSVINPKHRFLILGDRRVIVRARGRQRRWARLAIHAQRHRRLFV